MKKYKGETGHFRFRNPKDHPDKWKWVTFEDGDEIPAEMEGVPAENVVTVIEEKPEVPVKKDEKQRAVELKELTVKVLKEKAKAFGVKGYYSLNEDALIKAIIKAER